MIILLVILTVAFLAYYVMKPKRASDTECGAAIKKQQTRRVDKEGIDSNFKFEIANEKHFRSVSSNYCSIDKSVRADNLWVKSGESIQVHGLTIPGGMLYLGKGLGAVKEPYGLEPALINPTLAVNMASPDIEGTSFGYWPSYDGIPPEARAAYLLWLAGGRSDPNVPLGYVFLFFYGLERRLLVDARVSDIAKSEVPSLIEEVVRLRSIYTMSNSFSRYSSSLLQSCRAIYATGSLGNGEPPSATKGYEIPIDLAAGLGERLVAQKPITGPWAFAWYMHHPETNLRTPALRCFPEFKNLFLLRFQEKYPNGVKIKPNKRMLVYEYRAASAGLNVCRVEIDGLPDVRVLSGPVKKFAVVADACNQELDAYSRYLGRNPNAKGSLQAYALLPAILAGADDSTDAGELGDWVRSKLASDERILVSAEELIVYWEHESAERLSKKESVALAQVLERLGFGIEPDARFGGPSLKIQGKIAIFRLGKEAMATASREYGAATILLHLAAVVAAADGVVSEEEESHLEQHLEQAMNLRESERVRLRAHLSWLLSEPPGTVGLKKRLEGLSPNLKHQVAEFAVSVAGADGRIDPAEISALQKIYSMMGLDPESVFSDIHSLAAAPAIDPVTVALGQQGRVGRKLPSPPSDKVRPVAVKSFELDMNKVREKMRDTAEVASLLSEIFVEEKTVSSDSLVSDEQKQDVSTVGLDGPHSQLINSLKEISQMDRQEFELRCARLELLPEGAFDALNEAAFELCGAALLIGEDPIEIDVEILKEMYV